MDLSHIHVHEPENPLLDKKIVLIWSYGGGKYFNCFTEGFLHLTGLLKSAGITVVVFDYDGWDGDACEHDFSKQSLSSRLFNLNTIITLARNTFPDHKLILAGNSMGGALIAQLAHVHDPDGAVLVAPALFDPHAWPLPMKDKENLFTNILHKKNSWRNSKEPENLGFFKGPKLLIINSDDEIVTKEMTLKYEEKRDITSKIILPGKHKIFSPYLESIPKTRSVSNEILEFIQQYI